ncbi:MAG: hypothetical protein JO025_13490 [Verrucomicrobia bacterium]|nr:hypothetical protein [Verrucomicrobiota bacterium]
MIEVGTVEGAIFAKDILLRNDYSRVSQFFRQRGGGNLNRRYMGVVAIRDSFDHLTNIKSRLVRSHRV